MVLQSCPESLGGWLCVVWLWLLVLTIVDAFLHFVFFVFFL
jgi:hypothetical protein